MIPSQTRRLHAVDLPPTPGVALQNLLLSLPQSPEAQLVACWHDALCALEAKTDMCAPDALDLFIEKVRDVTVCTPTPVLRRLSKAYGMDPRCCDRRALVEGLAVAYMNWSLKS